MLDAVDIFIYNVKCRELAFCKFKAQTPISTHS